MLSNGISAPSGLQCSQVSISRSAWRRVAVLMSTTICCSGVGSKKSGGIARILLRELDNDSTVTTGKHGLVPFIGFDNRTVTLETLIVTSRQKGSPMMNVALRVAAVF